MERFLRGLRSAAEPTRLRILALCARGDLTVSELTTILGQSQPRVSRHLKLLVEAGLLQRFREGTWAYYAIGEREPEERLVRALLNLIPAENGTLTRDLERLDEIKKARAAVAGEFFRQNATQWDRIRKMYINDLEVERALQELIRESDVRDLLDVGTGTGRILEIFGRSINRGVGVDLSREMLAIARVNLEKQGLNNCHVRYGDMNQLPFGDEKFDAITFHLALHYAEDPADAIREAARYLEAQGRIIVVDFAPHNEKSLQTEHAHRWLGFDDEEIGEWFAAAGLAIRTMKRLPGNPLTVCLWSAEKQPAASRLSSVRQTVEA